MTDRDEIQPVSLAELKRQSSGFKGIPLVVILGTAIATAFVLHSTPLQSANDRSRWCTVYSLVDEGTWQIDKIDATPGWSTIDKVRHEGHFYSSKPALLPAIAAGMYWCVQKVTGWNILTETEEVTRTILFLLNVIPAAIAWLMLSNMLARYAQGKFTRRLLLLASIFATPIMTFLVTFNNHTVAACAIVFALSPALRILIDREESPGLLLAAGFFASFACTNELPALSFLGLLGLFLLRHDPRRTLIFYSIGALLPLLMSVAATYSQTGGWKPFYAYYGSEKYEYVHEGIPSYWLSPRGLDKNADSFPTYLLHCTVGHHGIFSLTPLFALIIPAWILFQWAQPKFRPVIGMSAILTLVVLGFYLSRTENYNYGGNTSTLRWLMWLMPIWILSLVPLLDRVGEKFSVHVLVCVMFAVGCFSTFWSINNPWTPPWVFTLLDRYDLLPQYDDPEEPFPTRRFSWIASLPESEEEAWIRLEGVEATGRLVFLELRNEVTPDPLPRRVRLTQNLTTAEPQVTMLTIDAERFAAGGKVDEWLMTSDAGDDSREALLNLLRGIPSTRHFNPGRARYIKTPLRDDYFTTQLGATQTLVKSGPGGEPMYHRCDVWYCDDLPFGVAQVNFSVRPASSAARFGDLVLKVVAASPFPRKADDAP